MRLHFSINIVDFANLSIQRVEYNQLFNRLRDRNMCPIVLRLLINMYIIQKIQVKWNDVLSTYADDTQLYLSFKNNSAESEVYHTGRIQTCICGCLKTS